MGGEKQTHDKKQIGVVPVNCVITINKVSGMFISVKYMFLWLQKSILSCALFHPHFAKVQRDIFGIFGNFEISARI